MPMLWVLLSAVCFGTTGTAVALGAPDASATSVGAARVVVGGSLLGLLALLDLTLRRARNRPSTPSTASSTGPADHSGSAVLRHRTGTTHRRAGWWLVLGAAGVVGYQPLFFLGTRGNGVAVGTVVTLGSAPLLTGAAARLLGGPPLGRRWTSATLAAVAGLAVLAASRASATAGSSATGTSALPLLASLGAGACYALYTVATKQLLDAGWREVRAVGGVFGGAAVLAVPLLAATDRGWLTTTSGLLTALWLGVVTIAVAYVMFARGLRALPAPTVATLTLAEPLTATALGLTVLQERLSAGGALGLAVIAAGLAVLSVPGRGAPVGDVAGSAVRETDAATPTDGRHAAEVAIMVATKPVHDPDRELDAREPT